MEKRHSSRHTEELKATVTVMASGEALVPGRITYRQTQDISTGGVRIRSDTFLAVDTLVRLDLVRE